MPQKKSIKNIIRRKSKKIKTQKKRINIKKLKKGGDAKEIEVKMIFYPKTSGTYKEPKEYNKDTLKNGKFMVIVNKRHENVGSYITDSLSEIDDFIANLLNGCSNGFCTEGKVAVEPYYVKTIKVNETK